MTDEIAKRYKHVSKFEANVAKFCNSPYAVAVDCCTNALFLSLVYVGETTIILPRRTYIGVYFAAKHAKCEVALSHVPWAGCYNLKPTNIFDCACMFERDMYKPNTVMCISLSYKKRLKVGRGGIILTDNKAFRDWCILARNLNKDVAKDLFDQQYSEPGWNMLLHPDLAEKGNRLLKSLPKSSTTTYLNYPEISTQITSTLVAR